MELMSIYYIAMFIVNVVFKLKSHSNATKSGFNFDMTINKLKVKIKFKKY